MKLTDVSVIKKPEYWHPGFSSEDTVYRIYIFACIGAMLGLSHV